MKEEATATTTTQKTYSKRERKKCKVTHPLRRTKSFSFLKNEHRKQNVKKKNGKYKERNKERS